MYPPPSSPSERPRDPKLCRDTLSNNTKRLQVILDHFGQLENFVNFCSFRSFYDPGAKYNLPGVPIMWVLTQHIIWNHIQVAEHRVSPLNFPSQKWIQNLGYSEVTYGTVLYPPPNSSSERPRDPKLCRDTLSNDTK